MEYPVVQKPGSPLVASASAALPKKRCKTSSVELVYRSRVASYGLSGYLKSDLRFPIGGHHYEPDLAFIDAGHGVYIDVEIDEPYAVGGVPTHYLRADGSSSDDVRNAAFVRAGWYVIRFSERQMFCETEACIRLVLDIAREAGSPVEIPGCLLSAGAPEPDARWNAAESRRLRGLNYRRSYLKMPPSVFRWRCVPRYLELGLPILRQALVHEDVRSEMLRSLSYLLPRKLFG